MKQAIQLVPEQHIHFIGIGGSGLSAIARILLLQGYQISGSDMNLNPATEQLSSLGAKIYHGHDAAYVMGAKFVIRSSAIKDNHVEVLSAQVQKIPLYKRYDIMSTIMDGSLVVAIAGTHGKTTTTSMASHVLIETGQDPTYIVGGAMANTGLNADLGGGRAFVIEADEYDNMFHGLKPNVAVITSIEFDHPDFFHTPDELVESFSHFIAQLPDDDLLICCSDDAIAQTFAQNRQNTHLPVVTYGIDSSADWRAVNIYYENNKTYYDVLVDEEIRGRVELDTPGRHNILNSMAALIIADNEGINFQDAANALSTFKGTGRRFDVRADIQDIIVIDDYAHHPTAIQTTLDAARQRYPEHDLWAIWQPHTFSRTQTLWDDYLQSFDDAHHVLVTSIYASREKAENFPNVSMLNFVSELTHPDAHFMPTFDETVTYLLKNVNRPAIVLIMSAGDAPEIGKNYVKILEDNLS